MLSDTHTWDSGRISVALLYDSHKGLWLPLSPCSLTLTQGALVASPPVAMLSDTYTRDSGRISVAMLWSYLCRHAL